MYDKDSVTGRHYRWIGWMFQGSIRASMGWERFTVNLLKDVEWRQVSSDACLRGSFPGVRPRK